MSVMLSLTMLVVVPIFMWRFGIESTIASTLATYIVIPLAMLPYTRGRLRNMNKTFKQ